MAIYALIGVLLISNAAVGIYAYTLAAVSSASTTTTASLGGGKLQVLVTFYPLLDWTQNVGGDRINATLLVPETTDVHAFEPTPSSISAIAHATVLVFNGAALEPWITSIVSSAGNTNLVLVNCSEGISLIKVPPQFQSNGRSIDPHIWLDPVDAQKMVRNILQGLIRADPTDSSYFTANANSYESKLSGLDQQFSSLVSSGVKTSNFVTFHTAFAYFAQRYNLTQIPVFGPFEEEPTPGDIQNVVAMIHQYHLCYVGFESLENPAIPDAIATQTGATLVPMNPIEGLTTFQAQSGQNYLTLMSQTLLVLTLSLNHVGCT